jgi:hypothetical protein
LAFEWLLVAVLAASWSGTSRNSLSRTPIIALKRPNMMELSSTTVLSSD